MTYNLNENPSLKAGFFLKNELKNRGITQENFAADAGVDPRTVRRWIRDGINSVDTVWFIADFFGLTSIGDIFS